MTYNVFGGKLNLALSISIYPLKCRRHFTRNIKQVSLDVTPLK